MKKKTMKKSSLIAVLSVLVLSLFVVGTTYADEQVISSNGGDGGKKGITTGDGCGTYLYTGGDCSVVWFKYTYNDNIDDYPETWIPSATNHGTGALWGSDGAIGTHASDADKSDSCRAKSKTFYAKGIAKADTEEESSAATGIWGSSKQYGLAAPTLKSVYDGVNLIHENDPIPTRPTAFAYSKTWHISVYRSERAPSDAVPVAGGNIVKTSVALEAFCKAVDYDNYANCVANNGRREDGSYYTIGAEKVTFEGDSNQATWFCAYDKEIGKPEELQSTSSVSIKKDGDTIVSATANDGEDKRDPETGSKTGLDAGKYHYDRSSIVSFQGDESTTNKIILTDEQCKDEGLFSWGGVPGINTSLISGSDKTGKNKCSYTDYSDFLLFPGQNKTVSVSVTHQSKIRKDGATNVTKATDSVNETSKATVDITANKHKCNNLSDAGDYYIGVNDKSNYRRLGIKKGDFGYQYTGVFPSTSENRTLDVFVKPDTSIKFEYQMCSGGLLYDDSVGSTEDKNYYAVASDATNIADKNWIWDGESLEPKNAINWLGITRDRFGSSVEDRLNSGYEATIHSPTKDGFKVTNNELGSTISNTLTADGDGTAISGNVKVPYNYIWEPKTNDITSGVVTVGGTYSFTPSFSKNGRLNNKVGETYSTKEKDGTKKIGAIIKLPSDTTLEGLNSTLSGMLKDHSDVYYYQGGEGNSPISKIGGTEIVSGDSDNKLTYNVDKDEIGIKICALSAVWPADSHNLIKINDGGLNSDIEETDPQNNALTKEVGDNPYWAFKLNCSTVAKAPTMSVEGASAVTAGEANGNSVSYNGRIFGSWTEYDLVANKVNNIGSGASLAYLNAQGTINVAVPASEYGTDSRSKMNPQTLGNLNSSDLGVEPEGQRYFDMASKYAHNIVSTFCGTSGYECNNANDYFNFITDSSGELEIKEDIGDNSDGKVNIVYGKNVSIKNDVKIVNAIIYATEKLDTCSDAGKDGKGNQSLYENCSNPLQVNGAVVAKNIVLDRAYGAGSVGYGQPMNPDNLSLRAEIFNYDPRVLFKIKQYYDSLNVVEETYIKELAPRY